MPQMNNPGNFIAAESLLWEDAALQSAKQATEDTVYRNHPPQACPMVPQAARCLLVFCFDC